MILTALPFTQFISVVQLFFEASTDGQNIEPVKDDMKYEEKITKRYRRNKKYDPCEDAVNIQIMFLKDGIYYKCLWRTC